MPTTVTLTNAKAEATTLRRDEIVSLRESPVSLMPEGLLTPLKPQQLRDFGRGEHELKHASIRRVVRCASIVAQQAQHNRQAIVNRQERRELPHGEVTVHAVSGGLRSPSSDTLIACAAITVSVEYPQDSR